MPPSRVKWYVFCRKQAVHHLPRAGSVWHFGEHHPFCAYPPEHQLVFLQDPLDKRRLLVSYEGLQASYREKVIRHYGDPYDYYREQKQKQNALNALLEVPPEEARAIKRPPEEGMPWMDAEKQQRTHTLCGYVRAYLRLKDKTIRRSFGYGTHEGAVGALLQMACEQRDDVPVTFSGLGKRVKVYGERGVEGLFPKTCGTRTPSKCRRDSRKT